MAWFRGDRVLKFDSDPLEFSHECQSHGKPLRAQGLINPLSPKGDQHQFSPKMINTQSREKVMRINKTITKGKML